jgi:putative peptide zinc metalloprotease protein
MWRGMTIGKDEDPTGAPGLWRRLELRSTMGGAASGSPVWPTLAERLAAGHPNPKLRPDLVVKTALGDDAACVLSDPTGGRYFRLGEREAVILTMLDGRRDLAALARDAAARLGPLPAQAVEQFVWDLEQAGLLDERASLWQRLATPRRSGPAVVWTMPGAEERLEALYGRLGGLFYPVTWGVAVFLFVQASVLILRRWSVVRADVVFLTGNLAAIPVLLVACYIAMIPVVLSHELAHALTCIHSGGRVSRLGLMIYHFLPAAFADVSDLYMLPAQARVAVYLAGPASTLAWAGLAVAVWALWPPGSYVHLIAGAVALVAMINGLVGLNPVAGYDGSEALAEWLAVPGLHRRALGYWWGRLRRRPGSAPAGRERLFVWYGAGFAVYNLAVIVVLVMVIL